MSREQLLSLAAGMRAAADWIEQNADLPLTPNDYQNEIRLDADSRSAVSAAAKAMGSFQKIPAHPLADYYYIISKQFGPMLLSTFCERGKVCKKIKIMKEVESWECEDSILAPELPAAVQ